MNDEHFRTMIFLMLVFYCVDQATDLLWGLRITATKVGGATSHDAFLAFFAIAVHRLGMQAAAGKG